jgi:transposase-like protein
MKRSKFSEAQIAFMLKQAEEGATIGEVCRKTGISEATFYARRKKYASLMPSEMRRLRQLEDENGKLKGFDAAEFVADLRQACVTPYVSRKSRYSAIDGRTTRHEGYALSIKHRKRIEEAFGWAKTVEGMAQTVYRGVEGVRSRFILTMAANNLARLPRLLAA